MFFVIGCMLWFSETLIMHDFPCAEEFDGVAHVGVVAHAEDIVVGGAGFLLCSEVFVQVGKRVALGLDIRRRPRHAACRDGVNAGGVVNVIRCETGIHDLLSAEIPRELMHDRADHLKMIQFLRAYRGHSI